MNAKELKIVNVQDLENIVYSITTLGKAVTLTDLEREYISIALNNILIKLKEL